jgi:putative acetyltransferase
MIRKATPADLPALLDIWLEATQRAHDFIEPSFWEGKFEDMRDHYLPSADVWLYERDGQPLGFFAVQEHVLAALFVSPSEHGQGIGSELLDKARSMTEGLELSVYERNSEAVAFYQRHGFCQIDLRTDQRAGHVELVMLDCAEMEGAERRAADREAVELMQPG